MCTSVKVEEIDKLNIVNAVAGVCLNCKERGCLGTVNTSFDSKGILITKCCNICENTFNMYVPCNYMDMEVLAFV